MQTKTKDTRELLDSLVDAKPSLKGFWLSNEDGRGNYEAYTKDLAMLMKSQKEQRAMENSSLSLQCNSISRSHSKSNKMGTQNLLYQVL